MSKIRECFLNEKITDQQWEQFENLLKNHDYLYVMSDDPKMARKGRQEADQIHRFIESVSDPELKEKATFLYLQYMKKYGIELTSKAEKEYKQLKKKFKQ